jgi:flagellar biosynthetic protein FliP
VDPRVPAGLPHQRGRVRAALSASGRLLAGLVLLLLPLLVLTAPAASAAPLPAAAPAAPVVPVAPIVPVSPVLPAGQSAAPTSSQPGTPAELPSLDVRDGKGGLSQPISLVLLLGGLSLIPGMLIMVTAFTRIVIVLGFVRSALGTQGVPPNQVLIGLAMFLTFFVMAPVFGEMNELALQPFLKGDLTQGEAFDAGMEPLRTFMLEQAREKDLALFVELSGEEAPARPELTPTTTLVPAYVIGELRAAFLIGFVIFVPFIVIDLVVSAALSAMGMAMLPPSMISLPFKLLLFVAVDGWFLITSSLVRSFN